MTVYNSTNINYMGGDDWFNTASNAVTFDIPQGGAMMRTTVCRLAKGYVGVVYVRIDGDDTPIFDTKPFKTQEKASKAAKKLALKKARRW